MAGDVELGATGDAAGLRFNRSFSLSRGYVVAYFDSERQMSCLQSWAAPAGLLAQPLSAQVAVYLITLAALFLGNAIASDHFMASVEQIVSKERTVISSDGQTRISRRIWHPTVANLTLLALGSSAPEILLSLTESASRLGKKPGHLGPATIVGTAAYNLLAITAVCTYVLPKGRVRAVRKAAVFWLTAVCSILAYVWMFVCLRLWTPGVITLVEALLTLAMMPLFVYSAYAMDCGLHVPSLLKLFGHRHDTDSAKRARHATRKNDHRPKVSNGAVSQDSTPLSRAERGELSSMMNGGGRSASHSASECATDQEATPLKNVGGSASSDGTATPRKEDVYRELMAVQRPLPGTSSHDLAERIANSFREWDWPESEPEAWSNAIWYKINARHKLSGRWHKRGGAHRKPSGNFHEESVPAPTQAPHVYRRQQVSQQATKDRERFCDIHFQGGETTVLENAGSVEIVIQREGDLSQAVMVDCKSKEGSAKARQDYNPVDGTLTFLPGEEWHTIVAQLIEDEEPDPDHSFTIHLTNPRLAPNVNQSSHQNVRVRTVDPQKFTVVILDDDEPGILGFDTRLFDVLESAREARISVVRHGGSAGDVYVDYYTRDRTAVAGRDYQATSGRLHFESGERSKEIIVPIIDDDLPNPDQVFRVYLCNPHKATLGRQYMATVKIRDDDGLNALTQEVQALISKRKSLMHNAMPGPLDSSSAWATQLRESFDVGGSYDDEGNRVHPGVQEYLLHLLTLWWKVLMALAPPPTTLGGWPLFVASLCVIGVITALVGELAKLLGCAIGLKDSVTAISIVAIGTSLPDTLASCYAVLDSPAADAAIGNIMGSNAVNVFLGLGLTWVLGASYYMAHPHLTSGYYCVPTVGLSETVITFIPIASVGTAVMAIRRSRVGGELGGTGSGKRATTVLFLLLWLAFVSLSAALTYWPSQMTAKLKPPSELDQFGCPCSKGFANC